MCANKKQAYTTAEKTIGSKTYVIKSVFVGKEDIKTMLLKFAERRAAREMGFNVPVA